MDVGKSHSWEIPTSRSSAPRAATISVPAGRRETTLVAMGGRLTAISDSRIQIPDFRAVRCAQHDLHVQAPLKSGIGNLESALAVTPPEAPQLGPPFRRAGPATRTPRAS